MKVMKDVSLDIIKCRQLSKQNCDKRANNLPKPAVRQPVSVRAHPQQQSSHWKTGHIVAVEPHRWYAVEVEGRTYHRNRVHIRDRAETSNNADPPNMATATTYPATNGMETSSPMTPVQSAPATQQHVQEEYCTKSGRVSKPPRYLE